MVNVDTLILNTIHLSVFIQITVVVVIIIIFIDFYLVKLSNMSKDGKTSSLSFIRDSLTSESIDIDIK